MDPSTRELFVVNRAHLKISPEKEKVWIYSNMTDPFSHTISNRIKSLKNFSTFLVDSSNKIQYNLVSIRQEKNKPQFNGNLYVHV